MAVVVFPLQPYKLYLEDALQALFSLHKVCQCHMYVYGTLYVLQRYRIDRGRQIDEICCDILLHTHFPLLTQIQCISMGYKKMLCCGTTYNVVKSKSPLLYAQMAIGDLYFRMGILSKKKKYPKTTNFNQFVSLWYIYNVYYINLLFTHIFTLDHIKH